jgi:multidrug efflux pump subunit AcrA (membrane-fusion protein)
MQRRNRLMVLAGALMIAGLLLAACGQTSSATAGKVAPAKVEKINGTELNRVVLTEKAAQRLDIQTAPVREEQINGAQRKVIPYAAVVYDLQGKTWAYTNPEPLTFVRQAVTVDYIEGDNVVLVDGPPAGTTVVTVGVPELYGTDTGIGK